MFDFVYKQKRLVQIVLAQITQPDFANAIRDQQDRMRQSLGANYDPAVFDNPEVRYATLEQLISQRLLDDQARRDRLRVSDDQVRQYISEIPAFQVDGKFSQERYQQLLAMQSPPKSSREFINDVRRALIQSPLQEDRKS